MIARFEGETRLESIVNHFSLDIVEEESFLLYVEQMGYELDADDSIIENLHSMWFKNKEASSK